MLKGLLGRACVTLVLVLNWAQVPAGLIAGEQPDTEWRSYAADKASTKYSPLDQINKKNVHKLEIAWRWQSLDYELQKEYRTLRASTIFEPTPLLVNGTLYTTTGQGQVVAITKPHTNLVEP